MFFDIGSLEFIALLILAILVFGPEKLPKMIQDAARFLRKVRDFSDNAKRDIRAELGPEFKDFEFDDLNPKRFARKHLLDNDDLGLRELRSSIDVRKELTEVADSVNGRIPAERTGEAGGTAPVRLGKDGPASSAPPAEPSPNGHGATGPAAGGSGTAPFDTDAT